MLLLILMQLLVSFLTRQSLFSSRSKLVDGSEVIQEIHAKPKTSLASGPAAGMVGQNMDLNANKPGLEPPSQGNLALEASASKVRLSFALTHCAALQT